MTPVGILLVLAWGTFGLVWLVGAFGTARTVRRESLGQRLAYILPALVVALLARAFPSAPLLGARFAPDAPASLVVGASLLFAGVAFAIWARAHLGRYWSGTVTLKEGHQLIRTGPYAIVRNPIYTGIIAGFLGSSILLGTVGPLLATLTLAVSFLAKIRREERFLADRFGEEFEAYKREVRSLVPGLW